MAKHETEEDKIFQKFKERTSLEPEQVLKLHFFWGGGVKVLQPGLMSGECKPWF